MKDQFFTKSEIVTELDPIKHLEFVLRQFLLLTEHRASMTRMFKSGKVNKKYSAISKEIHRLQDEYLILYKQNRELIETFKELNT